MSGGDDAYDFHDLGLKRLLKLFKDDKKFPHVRLGILGDKGIREGDSSNAVVGARHEFGTDTIPKRSFLRMPIANKFDKAIAEAGGLDEEMLEKIVDEKSLLLFLKKVGVVAEQVVADAFNTRGFGEWKESQMSSKKVKQTLVETGQLRDSITSEVVEND